MGAAATDVRPVRALSGVVVGGMATVDPRALRRLLIVGRGVAFVWGAFFGIGILGHLLGQGVEPESHFGHLVRWGVGGEAQEVMLGSVYLAMVWALWIGAAHPERDGAAIDLCLWANYAHSAAMLVLSFIRPNALMHLCGDTLMTILPTVALAVVWLPVRRRLASA
jgi:hypothetical protein